MKRIFGWISLILIGMIGLQSCDSDDNIVGGGIDPEPELVGCEASEFYDWDSVEFSTSLDGGADRWIAFDLEELTYFTVFINQPGFLITMYALCDGELGGGDVLFQFQTDGNSFDVGIAPAEDYYLNILNTRPGRLDFTFSLTTSDILYGCMDDDAINYDETANVDDNSCVFNDCNTDWYSENYGDMVLDCDGNCAPVSWIADGWCDDGAYGIYPSEEAYNSYWDCVDNVGEDCGQYIVPINLWCVELNFDEGDCEVINEGCTENEIEDCNGICAPTDWLGDGFCDDGSYEYNGNDIFFNCDEFNNDEGDCDVLGRTTQERPYPNGRIPIN